MTTIQAPPAVVGAARWLPRRLPRRLQTHSALRRLALASVVANVAIVVTGGAVRLTDSGLGCPTFPKCTGGSLTPTRQYGIHGIIEFANRQLTVLLAIIALATLLVALARREQRRLAVLAALSIPAQALLGGLTVLTHLNPWLVAGHFLFSMVIIAVTYVLWSRLRVRPVAPLSPAPGVRLLAELTVVCAALTLMIGTVVTGSGPHAGDKANGVVRRIPLQVSSVAQLHADSVMLLVGLSVGLLIVVRATRAAGEVQRAAATLVGILLAQAVIGYTQYFLHVPSVLVGLHMLGACLVWLAALSVLVHARTSLLGTSLLDTARVTAAG